MRTWKFDMDIAWIRDPLIALFFELLCSVCHLGLRSAEEDISKIHKVYRW